MESSKKKEVSISDKKQEEGEEAARKGNELYYS
jgi:hypothetical protein